MHFFLTRAVAIAKHHLVLPTWGNIASLSSAPRGVESLHFVRQFNNTGRMLAGQYMS
jgi:hypothetical protein